LTQHAAAESPSAGHDEFHDDIIHPSPVPFILVHVAALGALWSGVTAKALWLCLALYVVRMFGITAGFHRYFSHKTFKTSRWFQFVLAFLAQTTAQKGALWWAAKHRHHHKHSDTEDDVHSPRHRGFLYSHVGWIFTKQHDSTDYDAVPDLTKYRELVWLNEHDKVAPVTLAVLCYLFAGWPGLFVGFFLSTVLTYHGTFFINSLAHVHGRQRYVTGDDSRNNWWLAIITLGEGWHNNHHAYMASTRQGFRWYEFDPTYYALKAMSWVGLVWDLNEPPAAIVRNEKRLGRGVIEKVSRQLAASWEASEIAQRARDAWAQSHHLQDLRDRASAQQARLEEFIAELHMPHLPTAAEIRARAEALHATSPSMDEIVARTRELIAQRVTRELRPLFETRVTV
jgi:stearoyl-CoA desaturase (delta-9 desaturase)